MFVKLKPAFSKSTKTWLNWNGTGTTHTYVTMSVCVPEPYNYLVSSWSEIASIHLGM